MQQIMFFGKDDFKVLCPEWHFERVFNNQEKTKIISGEHKGKTVTKTEHFFMLIKYKYNVIISYDSEEQGFTIQGEPFMICKAMVEIGKDLGLMDAGY
jgi:hypothetical protein